MAIPVTTLKAPHSSPGRALLRTSGTPKLLFPREAGCRQTVSRRSDLDSPVVKDCACIGKHLRPPIRQSQSFHECKEHLLARPVAFPLRELIKPALRCVTSYQQPFENTGPQGLGPNKLLGATTGAYALMTTPNASIMSHGNHLIQEVWAFARKVYS